MRQGGWKVWAALVLGGLVLLLGGAAWVWREDILRTALDPRIPYQTYDPPPAPDYRDRAAWALLPSDRGEPGGADIFFVHPTTYDGGEHWNAPYDDPEAARVLVRDMLPNYAGPYQRLGRVSAPRYRQASLYTQLTLRDDAREARRFAYRDVREAFRVWRSGSEDRPFLLVGVGQGGLLAARLLAEEIAPDPELRARFVAAHLIETVTPPVGDLPACITPAQSGCVAAWASTRAGNEAGARRTTDRALVWNGDRLDGLHGRAPLCFNPLLGATGDSPAAPELARGGANASGLDWGARPAFLRRQVSTQCRAGVLHVSRPESEALRRTGDWAERLRAPAFNLFYADLEADAATRLRAWRTARSSAGARPALRPPVEQLGQQP